MLWKYLKTRGAAATATLSIASTPAAAANGIGDLIKNFVSALTDVPLLIATCAFVAGLGFITSGFFKWVQHSNNPDQVPMRQAINPILIGGGLCALTIVAGIVASTFGESSTLKFVKPPNMGG